MRTRAFASARSRPSFWRAKARRFWPTTSSGVVSRTWSASVAGGVSWAAAWSSRTGQTTRSPSATTPAMMRDGRVPARPSRELLHNDLAVLPGMGQTDVVEVAGLREGDGLRLALEQDSRVPLASLHRRRRVRQIADVGEGHGGPGLDADARGREAVFHVVGACSDRVGSDDDRSGRPGNGLRRRRRPQRAELTLQREGPPRVAVGAALQLVASGRDRDVLLTVDLVEDGRRVGAEAGLEPPQLLARLRIERQEVAVGLTAKHEAAGRDRRAAAAADTGTASCAARRSCSSWRRSP